MSRRKEPSMRAEPPPRGIRQTMSDLHIWAGLLAGWILYAMFLTGTASYFRDEISQYMRPELPSSAQPHAPAEVAQRVAATILAQAPGTAQMAITLPTERDPTASASWRDPRAGGRRASTGVFDPATGERLKARDTQGGDFFYIFHFNLHYVSPLWGRWIAGLCAMFMLVAIVSGVITHKKIFVDFFTFRWGKGQRSWLDAHTALSVLGLPFHFMITWSGLITLMVLYMPWGLQTLKPPERQAVTAEMRFFLPPGKPAGQAAPLRPLDGFVREAQQRWGEDSIGAIQITHPGDAQARVVVLRRQEQNVSINPQFMIFDGVSGKLLRTKDSSSAAAMTSGVLYGLHVGRFADSPLRWMYFLISLAGTAMVGTGLVLWTVKRRAKLPDPDKPYFGFRLVERLNIASIAGLSIAMATFLWANRLLPIEMAQRAQWEIHLFFICWGLALLHALLRPARKAWVEQFWMAAALLALLPVLNALVTDRPMWKSIAQADWVFAGIELSAWALAALHAALAIRTARHQSRARPRRKASPERLAQEAG